MPQGHATALFLFSIDRQNSTSAAKVFLTLFNPAGSGKVISVGGFFLSYMTTVSSPLYPMRAFRITSEPTGGTSHAESTICRFDTQRFAPAGLIRTNNPSVGTLGAAIFNAPPGVLGGEGESEDGGGVTSGIEQIDAPAGFNPFLLYPGEGVAMRQEAGVSGHFWNMSIVWRELSN